MAGDRRATMGDIVAARVREGLPARRSLRRRHCRRRRLAVEIVRLFQTELGTTRGSRAPTSRWTARPTASRPDPRQPRHGRAGGSRSCRLFAGYDLDPSRAGSSAMVRHRRPLRGSRFQLGGVGSLSRAAHWRSLYRDNFTAEETVTALVQALYDAADDNSATGGPNVPAVPGRPRDHARRRRPHARRGGARDRRPDHRLADQRPTARPRH